jgi:glycosyltransferase involved in cell wall biosynthesis
MRMIDSNDPDYTNTPVSDQRPCFNYSSADTATHPYVTIITPFYNAGPVFHETARSVIQQSFQQWEWLIINDGSTETEALSVLETYRDSDPRIRVVDHPAGQGLNAICSTGLRDAQTHYVVHLDSNSLLEPTVIEKWIWFLESYPEYAFVNSWSVNFGSQDYLLNDSYHHGMPFPEESHTNGAYMIRKAAYQVVADCDEAAQGEREDQDFWLRCARLGYQGGTVQEYLQWNRSTLTPASQSSDCGKEERLRTLNSRRGNGDSKLITARGSVSNNVMPDELPWENSLRKSKPRLLMIAPWLTFGGADKFNLDLLQQLTERGWELTIATTLESDNSWLPLFARYTPDIFILHHFLRMEDYPRFLRYLIRSRQIDVVLISNSELGYLLLPYLRAHCPEVTFIALCHSEEVYWKDGGFPRMAIDNEELLDLNIVSTEHLKRWMVERGADPERISICYTSIDTEEWRPRPEQRAAVRRELGLEEATPLVLYTARLSAEKQPNVLAQTVKQLRQSGVPNVALVVGDGPGFEWLHSFIEKHELSEQVRLLGAIPAEHLKRLMGASDIFFLPSQREGIAIAIYEAMACGLAVVAADIGGQRELVTQACGFLIARGDEQTEARQYARVLTELLRNPQLREEMGRAGRERVKSSFRLENMGERMASLFEHAMRLHTMHPRPPSDSESGRQHAVQALEALRLSQTVIRLKDSRHGASLRHNWRARVYLILNRLLEPCYRWGVDRRWVWVSSISEKVKKALLLPK